MRVTVRERELQYAVYTLYKREHCVLPPYIYVCVCVILCLYPAPFKKNVWILLESIYSNIILILYWTLLVQPLSSSSFLLIGCPSLIEVSGRAFCAHKPELCTINWIAAPDWAWFWQRFVPVKWEFFLSTVAKVLAYRESSECCPFSVLL